MNHLQLQGSVHRRLIFILSRLGFISFVLTAFVSTLTVTAQDKRYTENSPDLSLRSEARVDPSTLGMSIEIPLGGAPGRAGMNVSSTLRYGSKQWRMKYGGGWRSYTMYHTRAWPKYSENAVAGWTSTLNVPWIEYTGRDQRYDENGFPLSDDPQVESPVACYIFRLHLHLPDGSSHELRKSDTPQCVWFPDTTTPEFTGTFYSTDSSRIRFDTDTGTLYLPDGGRYSFGTAQSPLPYMQSDHEIRYATQYIDRNGNTINYSASGVTDTLGRTYNNPLATTPTAGDQTYTLPGFSNQAITYILRWKNLGDVLSSGTLSYTSNYQCPAPNQYVAVSPYLYTTSSFTHICASATVFNPVVLAEVILPNGRSYQFTYNIYGEIDRVTYPTGGYERFRYDHISPIGDRNVHYDQANRGVVERWVSAKGDGTDETHWAYAADYADSYGSLPYKANTTAPDGTRAERLLYATGGGNNVSSFGFDSPITGMTYDERVYDSSNQMMRRSLTEWQISGPQPGGAGAATRDPRAIRSVNLLLDTGGDALAASTTMQYDNDLNVISTNQYDFTSVNSAIAQTVAIGSISLGTLVRTQETTYLVNDANIDAAVRQAYRDRQLLGLPSSTRVRDAGNNVIAEGSMSYDEPAFPLLTYGSVTGWVDVQTTYRGNPTTSSSRVISTNSWLQTHVQYDQCGSVRKMWDARDTTVSNPAQIEYSSNYYYAYPTQTTSADPDGAGPATALVTSSLYDLTSGMVTATTDANNQTTYLEYATTDALGNSNPMQRLTRVSKPDGGWIAYGYSDQIGNLFLLTRSALDSTRSIEATKYFDGLGRGWRAAQSEGTSSIFADIQYDSMGRVWKTSNLYRAGDTVLWTTTAYDSLGRVLTVTTPDNAVVTSSYSGSTVTVTDQNSRQRKSVTDALGRLNEVYEDPSGLNYQTIYAYDVLDDLTSVTQGNQPPRVFTYDSLKRLTSATNPESGTVCYGTVVNGQCQGNGYDANGNLVYKTDARGVLTTYGYDALNRATTRSYSDGTPAVTYVYDTATNGKGRLSSVSSSVSTYTYGEYDALGRVKTASQTIYGQTNQTYTIHYTYDLAGHVKTMNYPSNRTVTNTYDNAGRLTDFNGYLGDNNFRNYSTGIIYSPLGGMTQEQLGTTIPIHNKLFYNSRGQLSEIREGLTPNDTSWQRGAIINFYGICWGMCGGSNSATPMPENNGNLRIQQVLIPQTDAADYQEHYDVLTQYYEYDSLNRLQFANEASWKQQYAYDRYGNRTIDQANTYGTGIPKPNFSVITASNRLGVPSGYNGTMHYDAAGNLDVDTYSAAAVTRLYDAENRVTKETQANSYDAGIYSYDGDGRRVNRSVGGVETWQAYGVGGELIAEYAANANPTTTPPQKEYGYRNGQLLITATMTAGGWGAPPSYTGPNPLSTGDQIKLENLTELRTAVNSLRSHAGLSAFAFTVDPSPDHSTTVKADHIRQLRTALEQARTALGLSTGGYQHPTLQENTSSIYAIDFQEIRNQIASAWNNGTSSLDLRWLVTDQLGTPRMIFDQSGSLATTSRHDYLPFGEELFAGAGGRLPTMGYTNADDARQKFTSKERDIETGLDYFDARYYSSTQGRFTSPDEFTGGPDELYMFVDDASDNPTFYANLRNPQSLNKYQYAYNNPLRYVDPDGHDPDGEPDPEPQQQPKTNTIPVLPIWPFSPPPKEVVQQMDKARDAIKDAAKDAAKDIGTRVATHPAAVVLITLVTTIFNPQPAPPPSTQAQPQSQTTTPPTPIVQPMPPPPPVEAHRKGKRKSTEDKHDKGTARKNTDYGREKGDAGRRPPRRPPGGETPKGGWPPKPPKLPE